MLTLLIATVQMFFAMADGSSYSIETTADFCEKVAELRDTYKGEDLTIVIADNGVILKNVIVILCHDENAGE